MVRAPRRATRILSDFAYERASGAFAISVFSGLTGRSNHVANCQGWLSLTIFVFERTLLELDRQSYRKKRPKKHPGVMSHNSKSNHHRYRLPLPWSSGETHYTSYPSRFLRTQLRGLHIGDTHSAYYATFGSRVL
ncbi:hypothetical protein VTK73DRAFT_1813 [Phialemonium thermophilum]|uniref:Uncharacterized protein n=1 Tax=Phialemonium thermophilum TaxID=223376 RepID=A0ABR3X7S2_9PEZI